MTTKIETETIEGVTTASIDDGRYQFVVGSGINDAISISVNLHDDTFKHLTRTLMSGGQAMIDEFFSQEHVIVMTAIMARIKPEAVERMIADMRDTLEPLEHLIRTLHTLRTGSCENCVDETCGNHFSFTWPTVEAAE